MSKVDPLYILRGHKDSVGCLDFNFDGDILLSGSNDGMVNIWDFEKRRISQSIIPHNGGVVMLKFIEKNKYITQGRDGYVKIYDLNSNEKSIAEILTENITFVKGDVINTNTNNLIVLPDPYESSQYNIYDIINKKLVCEVVPPKTEKKVGLLMSLRTLSFDNGSDNIVFSSYESGDVFVWSLKSQKFFANFCPAEKTPITCLDFNLSNNLCVSGTSKDTLSLTKIKLSQSKFVCGTPKIIKVDSKKEGFSCVKFREDDKLFVSCGWDNRIRLFNGKNGNPLAILKSHKDVVNDVCFNPSNKSLFVTSSVDKNICIWSLY
eukprot:TRINITY_DN15315_c0_g1_i1.p1 TRINITY_DN15315_c0_g1~~TRINITY_DN15315_c0_g1_i1.p1  ORF type:complete len:320 (+),score=70.59 TRINITY_DN15315_c0_g1_i1:57-1016(+)